LSRYKLLGVAAGPEGVALIAVDDQPGRPYRLHATLPDDAQVVALGRDTATLRLNDGQLLNLRVPAPGSNGASVAMAPLAPPMEMGNEQVQQMPVPTQAVLESQSVTGRKADSVGRMERSRDALRPETELTLERQD
jgi:hypothetical protein